MLICAIRLPPRPVNNADRRAAEPLTAESIKTVQEEIRRLLDDPQMRAAIEKAPPVSVKDEIETRPAP
jgi:hypothetical protein